MPTWEIILDASRTIEVTAATEVEAIAQAEEEANNTSDHHWTYGESREV